MNGALQKNRATPIRVNAQLAKKPNLRSVELQDVSDISAGRVAPLKTSKAHVQNTLLITVNAFILCSFVVSRWSFFQVRAWPATLGTFLLTIAILLIAICVTALLGFVTTVSIAEEPLGIIRLTIFTLVGALTLQVGLVNLSRRIPRTAANIASSQLRRACVDNFERSACVTQLYRSPILIDQLSANERAEIRDRLVEFREVYPKSFWPELKEIQKNL